MKEKCNKHPEQELVVIKYCPCCEEERIKNRPMSMWEIARSVFPIQKLPGGAKPIYIKDQEEKLI